MPMLPAATEASCRTPATPPSSPRDPPSPSPSPSLPVLRARPSPSSSPSPSPSPARPSNGPRAAVAHSERASPCVPLRPPARRPLPLRTRRACPRRRPAPHLPPDPPAACLPSPEPARTSRQPNSPVRPARLAAWPQPRSQSRRHLLRTSSFQARSVFPHALRAARPRPSHLQPSLARRPPQLLPAAAAAAPPTRPTRPRALRLRRPLPPTHLSRRRLPILRPA